MVKFRGSVAHTLMRRYVFGVKMEEYSSLYEQSKLRSKELFGSEFQPNVMAIDKEQPDYDSELIVNSIIRDFQDFIPSTRALVGSCFKAVREASYVLNDLSIPHYLTIGNVKYCGKNYYSTSVSSLFQEIKQGYFPQSPANAHAWLTLNSGQVVDLTILSSLNARENNDTELGWEQAIYVSSSNSKSDLKYTPMLVGFGYHLKVASAPFDLNFDNYFQWLNDFPHFAQHT